MPIQNPIQSASLRPLKSHVLKGRIRAVAFFPDGKRIVTGHQDGSAHIWNLDTGKEVGNPLEGHSQPVTNLGVLKGGNGVVTGGSDSKLTLFNMLSGKMITQLEGYSRTLLSPAWFPTMKRIVWTTHNTIYLRDIQDKSNVAAAETMSGHTHAVKSLAVHPGGKYLASGGEDKVLRVWDVCKRVEVGSSPLHPGAINNIAFSPDGDRILSISQMKTISLWS
ncbi:WD40-repeat-containing domain protein, partial [Gymnopilus junonius]